MNIIRSIICGTKTPQPEETPEWKEKRAAMAQNLYAIQLLHALDNKDEESALVLLERLNVIQPIDLLKACNNRLFRVVEKIAELQPALLNEPLKATDGERFWPFATYYAVTNKKEVAAKLIELGADVDAKDYLGNTVLHYANFVADTDSEQYLKSKNAKELPNKDGMLPSQLLPVRWKMANPGSCRRAAFI